MTRWQGDTMKRKIPPIFFVLFMLGWVVAACTPTPKENVIGYLVAQRLGAFQPRPMPAQQGTLTGVVVFENSPVAGATVLVAERTGTPHAAQTDADGRYLITEIPVGQYQLAAVAPGYDELGLTDLLGLPELVTIEANATTIAPPLRLQPHTLNPLPQPLAEATHLTLTSSTVVTAVFPAGAIAEMQAFAFDYASAHIDTLRVFAPPKLPADTHLPLLLMVYPTQVDLWQNVSTALASQGFVLVAISPVASRGVDVDAHAADARIALALALGGHLHPAIKTGSKAVALGGSFSSAILHRLLADMGDTIAGWVTVGGISNAFRGAADFYDGKLQIPPQYEYLIPALGAPHLYPLPFLRFSPVYTAAQLPPTLIIHTGADRVILIDQAYELEAALRQAHVPVEVFYYEDVSHYLQIDEQMTDAGRAMFFRIIGFANRILK